MLRTQRRLGTLGPPPVQIDDIIADLHDKLTRLSRYIDTHWPHPGHWQWCRLVDLYSRNAIRLLQLKEHRRALRKDPLVGLHRAIDAARGLLDQEWEADP